MKCPSVAGVWPASAAPPCHRITAAAVFSHPAALYTGGSDGSILRWALYPNEIRPLAVLCGHASAIADLASCRPTAETPNLISVCTDGVLCVWSLRTGRCRRRRRLPLWAGSPASLSPLPSSPRDVCVACSESPEGIRQGRAQLLNLSKDTDAAAAVLIWGESFNDEVQAVVVSGELFAFFLRARCVFRLLGDNAIVGEISLIDSPIYREDPPNHLTGGMFLHQEEEEESDVRFGRLMSQCGQSHTRMGA